MGTSSILSPSLKYPQCLDLEVDPDESEADQVLDEGEVVQHPEVDLEAEGEDVGKKVVAINGYAP